MKWTKKVKEDRKINLSLYRHKYIKKDKSKNLIALKL